MAINIDTTIAININVAQPISPLALSMAATWIFIARNLRIRGNIKIQKTTRKNVPIFNLLEKLMYSTPPSIIFLLTILKNINFAKNGLF